MTNITGSGLDDWIYWHLFSIITARNQRLLMARSIPCWTSSAFSSTVTNDGQRITAHSLQSESEPELL
jgi:hypothetical protein